jgi:15-cis-phytoene synthase
MSAATQQAPIGFAPSPSQLAMAYSVCRHITRSAAKNFYYAFLVLPRLKRHALCAVYAFMRRCDDIADDETVAQHDRYNKLVALLDELHKAQAGQSTDDPVLLALTDTQRRYEVPSELLDQLALGTMMDVQPTPGREHSLQDAPGIVVQYRTFEELTQYCYRVASVVGLVCIRVFGYRDKAAENLAERCGLAFQLTNIIRDVKEDAQVGRVYLPEQDLRAFGIEASELSNATDAARYRPLLAMEAERARAYYESGDQLIALVNEDSQPALWVLVNIYRRLLEKIAQQQYDVFHGKVSLTITEKVTFLGKGLLKRLT